MTYRTMTIDETIQQDDEFYNNHENDWAKVEKRTVGKTVLEISGPSMRYRRPIKSHPTASEVQQTALGWIEIKSEADLPKDNRWYIYQYRTGYTNTFTNMDMEHIKRFDIIRYLQYPDPPPPVNEDEQHFNKWANGDANEGYAESDLHKAAKAAWFAALEYERKKQKDKG
jgi:hypothetical protein